MKKLNYAEICIRNSAQLEAMLLKAEEQQINSLVISNIEEIDLKKALNSKCSCDRSKMVSECFSGKILGLIKLPVVYKGRVVQVKLFTNNIARTREILERNILQQNIINLKEYDFIKSRFASLGVKFAVENIKANSSRESSLRVWFNEISRYEENRKFLLFSSSFNDFKNFSRDESYNPESSLFIDRKFFYPSLDKLLDICKDEKVYVILTTVDKIEITGGDILGFVDDIMVNFEIDGIEFRSLRYSKELTKVLENYCLENNKIICKKNSINLKEIPSMAGSSNNVAKQDRKVI